MTKVDLGYAYQGHAPDTTIDVPDEEAQQLLLNGLARLTPDPSAAQAAASEPEQTVALGYPFDGHDPDDTITVPDAVAQQLLAQGIARVPADDTVPPHDPPADPVVDAPAAVTTADLPPVVVDASTTPDPTTTPAVPTETKEN